MPSSLPSFLVTLVLGVAVMYLLNRVRRQDATIGVLRKSVDAVQSSQLCNSDISQLCSDAVRKAHRSWISRNVILANQSKDAGHKDCTKESCGPVVNSSDSSASKVVSTCSSEGVHDEKATELTGVDPCATSTA